MVSRSTCGKPCNSFSSSDISHNNIIPPWCSSGRLSRRKKRIELTPRRDIRSSYLNQNIWKYPHDDKDSYFICSQKKTAKNYSKQHKYKNKCGKTLLKLLIFFLSALGCTMILWKYDLVERNELIQQVITKTSSIFPSTDEATSVDCRRRMGHLAVELSQAQRALRATLRLRRTLMLTTHTSVPEFGDKSVMQRGYVAGAKASKGSDTVEWGGRVALWGVLPLRRAAPPPHTVLALRPPAPADCWPFSGSQGEVVIELSRKARLSQMSVEHVRPDTARSAPKNFILYSILDNDTRVESARGAYTYNRPAKQYFPLTATGPVSRVAFTVLSNQGNERYTCLYRVHLYGTLESDKNLSI